MKYGFAVRDNDYDIQIKSLQEQGCTIIKENVSIVSLAKTLRRGDEVVFWRLDKLANSANELQIALDAIHQTGAVVILLQEKLNSSTQSQHMLDQIVGFAKRISPS